MFLTIQGNYEDSLKVLSQADKFPHLEENFSTIYRGILYQKIETLINQGRLNEAMQNIKKLEENTKKFFQKRENTMYANVLMFRSIISLYKNKNIKKTIQDLSEAIQIFNDSFHGDKKHRNQARTHFILGKAYKSQNDFQKAFEKFALSEEIYDILLKNKKVDDVSDLYTELALLGTDLKDEGITHKYLKAHIDTFGLDHPRTERILTHLDRLNLVVPN